MTKELLKRAIFMSVRLVGIIMVLGLIYAYVVTEAIIFTYAYRLNFGIGLTILIGGLLTYFTPTALLINRKIKTNRLIDHSTYHEKFEEEREHKHIKALELIYIGIFNITITGALQLALWLLA